MHPRIPGLDVSNTLSLFSLFAEQELVLEGNSNESSRIRYERYYGPTRRALFRAKDVSLAVRQLYGNY